MAPISRRFFWLTLLVGVLAMPQSGAAAGPEVSPVTPAAASASVTVDNDGWWNRYQGPQSGEPANPVRGLLPALPSPPNVPAAAVAVGSTGGQMDKMAAFGVRLEVTPGSTLRSLTLKLLETPEQGTNVNAPTARIVACPATALWAAERNGAWERRSGYDCERGLSLGMRAGDGSWTFDLTDIALLWVEGSLSQNGVAIVMGSNDQGVFQVSFRDTSTGAVEMVAVVQTPPAPAPSPDTGPEPEPEPVEVVVFPSTTGSPPPVAAAPTPKPRVELVDRAVQRRAPGLPRNVMWRGWPLAVLAFAGMILLGLLTGFVLGPAGDPAVDRHREGAVSRALARRSGGPVPSTHVEERES